MDLCLAHSMTQMSVMLTAMAPQIHRNSTLPEPTLATGGHALNPMMPVTDMISPVASTVAPALGEPFSSRAIPPTKAISPATVRQMPRSNR